MADDERTVWTGDLTLPCDQILHGLRFSLSSSPDGISRIPHIPAAALEFLALVDPNRIPLHLAVGPNLRVTSSAQDTVQWLSTVFHSGILHEAASDLHDESLKHPRHLPHTHSQCRVAVLAKIANPEYYTALGHVHDDDPLRLTEILIYAVANRSDTVPQPTGLLGHEVFALPLSSDAIHLPFHSLDSDVQPPSHEEKFAFSDLQPVHVGIQPSQKDRLGDLFDAASHERRRAKAKGGQSVSRAAHQGTAALRSAGTTNASLIKIEAVGENADPGKIGSQIETDGTAMRSWCPSATLPSRPSTHEAEVSNSLISQDALQDKSAETRNRQLISRTVMAGMRIRGLQQGRQSLSKTRKDNRPPTPESVRQPPQALDYSNKPIDPDAEYKAIYHQTYKGVVFALRNRIASVVLRNDEIRDLVDTLLALFSHD